MKIFKHAFFTGLVPAILEGVLVYSVEPSITKWTLAQVVLFWFTCGFTIYWIEVNLPVIIKAVLFTVFLNLPWYIAESIVKGKPEHLIPLIIASLIQGLIIGFFIKILTTKNFVKTRANLLMIIPQLIFFIFFGCNFFGSSNAKTVLEWAPFTLNEGVDEKTLILASNNLQKQFLEKQNGFLHRSLIKGQNRQWVDIVTWNTRDDAEAAEKQAMNNNVCLDYFHLMRSTNPGGQDENVSLFEIIAQYKK